MMDSIYHEVEWVDKKDYEVVALQGMYMVDGKYKNNWDVELKTDDGHNDMQ